MKQLRKFKPNYFLHGSLTAAMLFTITWKTAAQGIQALKFRSPLTAISDTTKPILRNDKLLPRLIAGDTIKPRLQIDSNRSSTDTLSDSTRTGFRTKTIPGQRVDTFHVKMSKDSLDAPVKYEAEDSAVILVQDKKILLYGKAKVDYKETQLTAPKVEVDNQTQVVTAYNAKDSTGLVLENATFKDGTSQFSSDTIRYNFKTQKGLTQNTIYPEGEFIVHGEVAKKIDDNTTFIKRARFTTCDLDDPHFSFVTNKMKIVNKKLAISGPAHPEFEGVPIPIYLPFGFFPLSQGRHSGFLPPQFSTNEQYGLGLEGLGYYKVINDYWDARLYGNIYSYGGWSAHLNPTYRKRYRFNGAFNISMQYTKLNFKGDPDYLLNKSYFVTWSHSVDTRARPGTNFSASVNAGSTQYNKYVPNAPQINYNNQLGSSITYSKTWIGKPYNLTLSANHDQNNQTHLINVSLPNAAFTVATVYPFQGKDFAGTPKWYQKLGIGYVGSFRNQVSFYDTAFTLGHLIDTFQWGASHSIPITLSLPPLFGGALIISPSVSYEDKWIAQTFRRVWDTANEKLDTVINKGFYVDHSASFSLGLSTAVFGTYQFKHSRVVAIRHVIRPSLSISYKPDLSKQHFYRTQVDTTGYQVRFSEFEGSLYGYYPEGKFGGVGFNIDNNVEMKWRSKKDTGVSAIKKIKLIDGYGLSMSYNFFADSMNLSLMQLYFRTTLFEKINISANGVLDPYRTNERGQDIAKYAWQGDGFSIGRLSNGSISISTSFRSKPKDQKKEDERKKQSEIRLGDPNLVNDQQRLLEDMQRYPQEFVDFNIPWQVSFGYSMSFSNRFKPDFSGFKTEINSNLSFNGSFNLTPKWNFSCNGYYDFKTNKIQTFSMSINREMHCWQLSINVIPIGLYRSFSFSISPKSTLLQDLRINRSRSFTSY